MLRWRPTSPAQAVDWNVDAAVSMFMDSGGDASTAAAAATAGGSSTASRATAGRATGGGGVARSGGGRRGGGAASEVRTGDGDDDVVFADEADDGDGTRRPMEARVERLAGPATGAGLGVGVRVPVVHSSFQPFRSSRLVGSRAAKRA